MKQWSNKRFMYVTESLYAVGALFALTQGPVYQLWKHSAERIVALPSPSMSFIYFASFMAIQAPGIFLFARRVQNEWLASRQNQALLLFLGWIGLSVLWSTFARHSLPEFIALASTSIFGAYLAISFSIRDFWRIVLFAMALGVATSWFAVVRLWDDAYNYQDGVWMGIYYNRNSLAPVAALGIVSALGFIVSIWERLRTNPIRAIVFGLIPSSALVVFATLEIWNSGSQTSPFALLVASVTVGMWLLFRWLTRKVLLISKLSSSLATLAVLLVGTILVFSIVALPATSGVSADFSTLNSRRTFWAQNWMGIVAKPWLGWGWMASWHTPEFFTLGSPPPEWVNTWSHNGYHDVILGGGVVAGLLFLIFLIFGLSRIDGRGIRFGSLDMILAAFVLAAATQESFFIGSHFLWALLVTVLSRSKVSHPRAVVKLSGGAGQISVD